MMHLFIILGFLLHVSASELVHVHVLYRHGDRTPIIIYPNDPHQRSAWTDGPGELTNVGKNQHFALGKFIRQRYGSFIRPTFNATEFYARSTDVDRTLMSAESNLAGLFFPSDSKYQFNELLKWNPIPIHTVDQSEDSILYGGEVCPRVNQLMKQVYSSPAVVAVEKSNQALLLALQDKTGMQVTLENMWSIVDATICERAHNMSIPSWITPPLWKAMKQLDTYAWNLRCSTLELRRLRGGALLYVVLEHLQSLSRQTPAVFKKGSKMIMYSGHDFTVSDFLSSLHASNGLMPPYATAVFVELHHVLNQYLVKFFIHNTTGEPFPLTVRGCTEACPVDQLARLLSSEILHPDEYKSACEVHKAPLLERDLSFAFSFVCIAGILCILIIIAVYIARQTRYRRYRSMGSIQSEELDT